MQSVLTLTPGGTPLAQSLGFEAAAVIVDNYTSSYVNLSDVGRAIPPWNVGVVVPVPPGIRQGTASLIPTVPAVAGPPVPVSRCDLTWTDAALPAAAGHLLSSTVTSQPEPVGTVVAGVGASVTDTFALPAGTQAVAFTTTQTGGGSLTGSAVLTFTDGAVPSTSLFFRQNPVITNGWSWLRVVQAPTNEVAVTLDMTGVSGAGGQFTTEVVALPYPAAVGVVTDPGGSVALKPSSGNLIMAIGDNQQFYGQLANPSAGNAIVTSGALAIGHYRVRVRCGYGHTADTIEDNMKLVLAGVLSYTQLRVPQAADTAGVDRVFENLNVSSNAALHVEAVNNHVNAGAVYWATLDITPLSSS